MPLTLTSHALPGIRASARHGEVRVVSGGDGKTHRSTDNGATWSSVEENFPEYVSARAMVYSDGAWVIGGDSGAMSRSTDNGATWSAVDVGGMFTAAMCVADGGVIVAVGGSGVIKTSSDGGATWITRTHGLGTSSLTSVVADGAIVLVGGQSGKLARSADAGATWTTITTSGIGTSAVNRVNRGGGRWMVMAQDRKVSTSVDLATWAYVQLPADAGNPNSGYYANAAWIIGNSSSKIFRSTTGTSWDLVYTHGTTVTFFYGAASPTQCVMASSGGHLILSEDDGATWAAQDPLASFALHADYGPGGWVIAANTAMYTTSEADESDRAALEWPVDIVAAPQIRVTIAWPVTVAPVYSPAVLWPVDIIAAAAVGGLGGAGGWPAAPSRRWQCIVTLGGVDVSAQILGPVEVTHRRRTASIASFSFRPPAAMLPTALIGRDVTIAHAERTPGGPVNVQVLFSGVVQDPSIDITAGIISCLCSDKLQEAVAAMTRGQIDSVFGGRWHSAVFGEPADNREYAEQRIQTVPADYALDVSGQLRRLDWYGPALRPASVELADHFADTLTLTLPTRDAMVTRCTVKAEYRYPRRWVRGATAQYAQYLTFFQPYYFVGEIQPSKLWLTTALIQGATSSVPGWTRIGNPAVVNPVPATYNLGTELEPLIYIIKPEVAPSLALSFRADFAARWVQTVTEYFEIDVVSPDLELLIGRAVPTEIGATLTADYDSDWASDKSIAPWPLDGSVTIPVGDIVDVYQPAGAAEADRDDMLRTLLDVARCDRVMQSARSGRGAFDMPLRPDMWLDWVVTVQTPEINAAGPVEALRHRMDASVGVGSSITSVEIAIGLHGAVTPVDPTWALPSVTDTTPAARLEDYAFEINTYIGGMDSSPPVNDEMVGFFTNLEWSAPGAVFYEHSLTIQSPEIIAGHRDAIEFPATAQFDIEIPKYPMELL